MSTNEPAIMLEIRDLVVRYGDVVAVEDASLDARRNAITALVGPSGCGKTSLLRAIAGFEAPAQGTVTIAGRTVAGNGRWVPPERRAVGMVFQEGALFPHVTVRQNVGFGLKGRPDADSRARAALDLVGLAELGERYPDELSGGQQQRVGLARALAPSPEIVLLDEPFANLDAALRQRVREEVSAILREAGTTAVVVTHDQEEALSIADRLAIMERGRILQSGRPEEVYARPSSEAVAEFIGDGQLLPCDVANARVKSTLGSADCTAVDGPGLLLVRPEDLVIVPDSSERGVPGEVVRRRFFGHDRLHEVRLGGGDLVSVRCLGSDDRAKGSKVRLALRRKTYRLFSRDRQGGTIGEATPDPESTAD